MCADRFTEHSLCEAEVRCCESKEGRNVPDYLRHSQKEEDENYRKYAEYFEEVNMSDEEFTAKMKREHGKDWHRYTKPARILF